MGGLLTAAVVGCGPRGREHARALGQAGLSLIAVVDHAAESLRAAVTAFGVPGYRDLAGLFTEARPDVVVLATQPGGRVALADQVLREAGVRALVVEKPMATSLREADRLVAACAAAGVRLLVSHQLRFSPEFVAMKRAIENGELGSLEFLRGVSYGNILNQGPHLLDAIRWMVGGRPLLWAMSQWSDDPHPLGRYARGPGAVRRDPVHSAPAWMVHELAFQGGIRAAVETGVLYQPSRLSGDEWLQKRLTVVGSEGMAECQAAGYFKITTSSPAAASRSIASSLDAYVGATTAFYEELRQALGEGRAHRNEGRDALASFEAVVACAQAALDGGLVTPPLPRERDQLAELARLRDEPGQRRTAAAPARGPVAGAGDGDGLTPDVTVVIAMQDHRGLAEACVASWTRDQTCARDRFEVILVSDGADPALDERLRGLLGPRDRLLVHPSDNELLLYDIGARAARGRLLLITEPHCVAEPECLEELVAFFATHDYDGACCRSIGIRRNRNAGFEERLYEEGFQQFSRRGDWRKVILRGFAVYRDVYLEVGGFDHAFRRFAEWALAATLDQRGHRLGYAAGATVRHAYTTGLREYYEAVGDFTRGECAYRERFPAAYCRRYFGEPPEWESRLELDRALAGAVLRASWRRVPTLRPGRGALSMLAAQGRSVVRTLPLALFGPRWARGMATLSHWAAVARYAVWYLADERGYRAFAGANDRFVRRSRLAYIAAHPPRPAALPAELPRCIADVPAACLVGFHPVEEWQGVRFRWSGPVAIVRLALAPGAYRVAIDTGDIRRHTATLRLGISFNRHRIRRRSVRFAAGVLTFELAPAMFASSGEQQLALTCNPIRPRRHGVPDDRELGLPIHSIEFHRR